ncbi:MAG: precorrin-4 C(11)-methyltransferase [Proteobacteria bacterium]|nr:precorrin-4 C(11)-methyltransferase [Pseudomonadota bacterium]
MSSVKSIVRFVGAGPGDPDLITVKGRRYVTEADVVVYAGSLVMDKHLEYCKEGAELHNSASMDLDEIMAVMVGAAKAGRNIVRLHTGDSAIYGAIREQCDRLDIAGIEYEVVPGVTAALAAAAVLKKELTVPGVTQSVIITRLEGRTPVPEREKLAALAAHGTTLCIYLSISMMDKLVEELSAGYGPDTPVAVVYRATWPDETIIKGTLEDIAEKVAASGIDRHAIIVVGRAIGDRPDPNAEESKLYDATFTHAHRAAKPTTTKKGSE